MTELKGYLASPLFSLGEQMLNEHFAKAIRKAMDIDLYVPQENDAINDKSGYASSLDIAKADTEKLVDSDVVFAVIDGCEIDSGVSAEIGVAYAHGIPVFALYSDMRQDGRENIKKVKALVEDATENQFTYRNLYVVGLIKDSHGGIYQTIDELIEEVQGRLCKWGVKYEDKC